MKGKIKKILLVFICMIFVSCIGVSAVVPYETYTIDSGRYLTASPHAYIPVASYNSTKLNALLEEFGSESAKATLGEKGIGELNTPWDLFVDDLNHVYIADSSNNRIVCLDEEYVPRLVISTFVNDRGIPDQLKNPRGVFVTEDEIFVADADNSRIVIFDKLGNFADIVPEPKSEVIPDKSIYTPKAVAVDSAGRIYVVSSTTNYGVISLDRDGSFNGFIGPQKVSVDLWAYFWRIFQTNEQIANSLANVSVEYYNLTIDSKDFVYVTTQALTNSRVAAGAVSGSADDSIVKKLNPTGKDIMERKGWWGTNGEVDVIGLDGTSVNVPYFNKPGVSKAEDVALGPSGTWSFLDSYRSRIYTYNSKGDLIFAFGETGDQLGCITDGGGAAIAYQGTNIIVLDRTANSFTVYKRTTYGDMLMAALQNNEDRRYDAATEYYVNILKYNQNFDIAYDGIAEGLYRDGDVIKAMQYYKLSYNVEGYSAAYQIFRKDWIEDNLWIVLLTFAAAFVAVSRLFKFANKINKRGRQSKGKRNFLEEIMYGFHVIFHPFDGFWDLKHEKRGSVRGATFWVGAAFLITVWGGLGTGWIYNVGHPMFSLYATTITIVIPLVLWITANWCLTTLFEGEGSYKDVFVATSYCLVPYVLLNIPVIILSNFVTVGEAELLGMILSVASFWMGFLIFFGMMVTHDYTLGKNILTTLGTLLGMAIIIFLLTLFGMLITRVYIFVYGIIIELRYRMNQR